MKEARPEKEYILYDFIYKILKIQTDLVTESSQWLPRVRDRRQQGAGGEDRNGYEETLEGPYVNCFDCSDGSTYKLKKLYILNM